MEDDEEFWITYEEYALLKDRVELAVKDYGLEVVIYINNLYPEYYPIEFDLNEELLEEIRNNFRSRNGCRANNCVQKFSLCIQFS